MLICWKALSSSTAGTKSQCKHSLAVQVTMDHSLKIIGLAAWERELSELCLSISFLFPFWISSRAVLKPAFLLLAFACVKGKAQAQKHITSFSPHKVFIQMLASRIFPSFSSLLTGFQLSFAISLLLSASLLRAPRCSSSQGGRLTCRGAEQRGWSQREPRQPWKRQSCASIQCHTYVHWLSRGAGSSRAPPAWRDTYQQGKEGPPSPGAPWFRRASRGRRGLAFLLARLDSPCVCPVRRFWDDVVLLHHLSTR